MVDYVMWTWFFKEMLRDLPEPFASALFKFYQRLQSLFSSGPCVFMSHK